MSALNVTSDLFSDQAAPKSRSYDHSVVTPYLFHEKSSVEMPEGLSIFLRLPYSITTLPRIWDTARRPDTQQAYDGEWLHWGWSGTHVGDEGIKEKGGGDQNTTRSPRGGVRYRHSGRADNMSKSCDWRQHGWCGRHYKWFYWGVVGAEDESYKGKFQGIIRFNSQLFWGQTTWGPHMLLSS